MRRDELVRVEFEGTLGSNWRVRSCGRAVAATTVAEVVHLNEFRLIVGAFVYTKFGLFIVAKDRF